MKYSMIKKVLASTFVAFMVVTGSLSTNVYAATSIPATSVTITNAYEVMAVGESVDLNRTLTPSTSNDKTYWTSSDTSIAAPDKQGKFIAKKSGTVTITATTTSGEKASVKILVVSKYGVTSKQSKIDKMLAATNIKNVYIKNLTGEESYTISEGTYSKKTLRINAPYSEVTNYGKFKKVIINDVKDGTYYEGANGNEVVVNDDAMTLGVLEGASIRKLTVAKDESKITVNNNSKILNLLVSGNSTLSLNGNGKVNGMEISSDANVTVGTGTTVSAINMTKASSNVSLDVSGTVGTVNITEAANVTLTGDVTDLVKVVVSESAAGATIVSSVPVELTSSTDVDVKLEAGAEGSTLTSVGTEGEIALTNDTTDTSITVDGNGTVTTTPSDSTDSTSNSGSSSESTSSSTVGVSTTESVTTYTLPTALSNIKSAVVTIDDTSYNFTSSSLVWVKGLLSQESTYVELFKAADSLTTTMRDGMTATITGEAGSLTKTVTFMKDDEVNGTFTITLDEDQGTATIATTTGNSYVLSYDGNQKLIVDWSQGKAVADRVSITVTH